MNKVYLKIILPSIISIFLFILIIFQIIIPRFEQTIMNGKREMIKELTNSAWSILSKYESDEKNGLLTLEEAKKTAVSRIQYLRYGEENKDYFWITDMYPVMIIHPYRSDLNGKDLTNFVDPNGKRLFVEFVNTVKAAEHGYVDYMWQWKDDSLHIVPKLSYVKIFKPWGWVIGTGIYIEDVRKEIYALTNRLIWISGGISFLIALLLLIISQQSLKIERKRIKAESELHDSREKYRTLVEAATEGLIMLIDGVIGFSNSVISKMTGYETNELNNLSLKELISENNSNDIVDIFSKNSVKEGQYEINLKNKKGGFLEVLITSSSALLHQKTVNIIVVKDISIDRNSGFSILDYQKLISTLNVGFFRASLDARGRFIFANDNALRILGYDSFKDLSETHFLEMLAGTDDKITLQTELIETGYFRNKILKIIKKNSETAFVKVTLILFNSETSKSFICDGVIEDITIYEELKLKTNNLIAELKSNDFLIERPVKEYMTQVCTLDADKTISDVINIFSKKGTDNVLLTKGQNTLIGIITSSDIQKRVLSLNLNLDNPAYLIMSSPVTYISENTSLINAINICDKEQISHLIVRNNANLIAGVVRISDIYQAFKKSLSFYINNIEKAETNDELKQCFEVHQLLLEPLIRSEMSVTHLTMITSSVSDSVIRRIIALTIEEIGEPPVGFSFICLGSEGRKEETLFTDQDNAIIYEDVPAANEIYVDEYFSRLGEKVCDSLNYIGYSFCKGKIMAKNQQWCKPISVWEGYFANWITTPEPQNVLEATIFFDFRNIYGDEKFSDRLRKSISKLIKERDLFLYHMAYNTFNTKLQQVSSGSIISDRSTDTIDLKEAVTLITMFTRTYSLQNNIWYSNTIERLNALRANQIINVTTIDEILFAYNYLMKLRFRNQIELSAGKLPMSNILNTKHLLGIELSILKKVLSLFPAYQHKISVDFRIAT